MSNEINSFDHITAWSVCGVVTTIWLGLFGIFLAMETDIKSWALANQSWLLPVTWFMCITATLMIGWILGRYGSYKEKSYVSSNEPVKEYSLTNTWEREKEANVVWVVSPELYYDILNPECQNAVMRNIKRNVNYAYIIEKNDVTDQRLKEYKKIFNLSDSVMNKQFLVLPASDLTKFQTEIVIYDPGEANRSAFGYPHASAVADPDVIVFPSATVQHYIERFNSVWLANKDYLPPTLNS